MSPIALHHFDHLTGLLDREGCIRVINDYLNDPADTPQGLAVLWLDIDRFKQVNASFGHLVGDSVLTELARRLDRTAAGRGRLARMGGDEFVLIAPQCPPAEAERLARDLLTGIAQPLNVGTARLRPAASIGIAISYGEEAAHDLLERADRAMFEAKRQGGGQYALSGATQPASRKRKHLEREDLAVEECLHNALETGGLYLNYQPIIRVEDGTVDSVEALMRCHMRGTTISPGRFIPVAEKTGLITRLGEWSLLTAARFVGHMNHGSPSLRVAVNISRASLLSPSFTQALHAVRLCSGLAAERLELEITESLFMDTSDQVQSNLRAAVDAGFQLAIDDFGTGYSCLACLKDLPARKIKLDRAFVLGLPHDKRSLAVARAMTHLARELDMSVVAEGVETEEQYEALREVGVTAIQGYYVARPMDENSLVIWLEQRQRHE